MSVGKSNVSSANEKGKSTMQYKDIIGLPKKKPPIIPLKLPLAPM